PAGGAEDLPVAGGAAAEGGGEGGAAARAGSGCGRPGAARGPAGTRGQRRGQPRRADGRGVAGAALRSRRGRVAAPPRSEPGESESWITKIDRRPISLFCRVLAMARRAPRASPRALGRKRNGWSMLVFEVAREVGMRAGGGKPTPPVSGRAGHVVSFHCSQ